MASIFHRAEVTLPVQVKRKKRLTDVSNLRWWRWGWPVVTDHWWWWTWWRRGWPGWWWTWWRRGWRSWRWRWWGGQWAAYKSDWQCQTRELAQLANWLARIHDAWLALQESLFLSSSGVIAQMSDLRIVFQDLWLLTALHCIYRKTPSCRNPFGNVELVIIVVSRWQNLPL